ncbi:MAG TPA: histidine kinase, partial [Acidobacteriota bacterium]|nr:histidine kinase [Acidobacteriota bacterium]
TDPVSVMRSLSLALVFLFSAAGVLALIVKRTARQAHIRNGRERQQHKWSIGPAALTIALISVIALSLYEEKSYPRVTALASRALPLAFILVGTYSRSRFEFFDAFVKQGVYFLLALVLLTALFAGLVPVVQQLELGWARPWVYAVAMLPIVFASPWVYRQLGMWLDRVWLGRRFTTVQAIKYFLSEVREATNEQSLVERANKCLSTVMQAPARIILGQNRPEAEFDIELRIPIPSRGEPIGCILMGKRSSDEPFFGEDIALLSSLADVFHSLLDTIRLQIKKREQEKREQDLMIEASRSELKALRAQINPHFLFNALNAIAGLIERDPVRAEETVERLAEVFRYVLRRSENEWACLKDELEFIQAYLEIEQARFGKHLQVSLEVDPATRELRIPAMIIQTVVENAVKHGVSSTRGLGLVRVRASQSDQILKIEVLDNGPGFKFEEDSQSRQMETGRGYGLKNVRQRLQGYFGEAGKLTVGRDKATGQTCVSISIPVLKREFEQVAYDSSANRR